MLCTTIGETAADTLTEKVGLSPEATLGVFSATLFLVASAQFASLAYFVGPGRYVFPATSSPPIWTYLHELNGIL